MNGVSGKTTKTRIGVASLAAVAAAGGALALGLNAHASTSGVRVTVTEREYRLTLSKRTFKPGTVRFVVVNRGKIAHSLAIKGPGVSRRVTGTIRPGGRKTLVVRLSKGSYSLWCPVPGHAALGMKATISVAGTSVSGTTTTSGGGGGWG